MNFDSFMNSWFKTCPICGKRFVPAPFHTYRRNKGSRQYFFCSYRCMKQWLIDEGRAKSGRG